MSGTGTASLTPPGDCPAWRCRWPCSGCRMAPRALSSQCQEWSFVAVSRHSAPHTPHSPQRSTYSTLATALHILHTRNSAPHTPQRIGVVICCGVSREAAGSDRRHAVSGTGTASLTPPGGCPAWRCRWPVQRSQDGSSCVFQRSHTTLSKAKYIYRSQHCSTVYAAKALRNHRRGSIPKA